LTIHLLTITAFVNKYMNRQCFYAGIVNICRNRQCFAEALFSMEWSFFTMKWAFFEENKKKSVPTA